MASNDPPTDAPGPASPAALVAAAVGPHLDALADTVGAMPPEQRIRAMAEAAEALGCPLTPKALLVFAEDAHRLAEAATDLAEQMVRARHALLQKRCASPLSGATPAEAPAEERGQ